MDEDREERIRARAYQLWEAEGGPHGRDEEHWRRAEDEIDAEGNASQRAFEDAIGTPTGADMAAEIEAASAVEPTTDDAKSMHEGRITPAG